MPEPTIVILGLEIPDAGPIFLTALALHVAAGLACVASGALAAVSPKRPGRHPRGGRVYLCGITVVFVTATVMAAIRWEHNVHLFAIAVLAFATAMAGWRLRRRQPAHWMAWHGTAMATSYIALLTGFYVDNGRQLPLWDRLPYIAYWFLPLAVGAPLTWWALARNHALPSLRTTRKAP